MSKFAKKHVFIAFSRKPTGFEIFSKMFETKISKNTKIEKLKNQERPVINPMFWL